VDVLSKLTDAASMFWQALDDHERRMVLYAAGYIVVTVLAGLHQLTSERKTARLRAEIVAELRGSPAP
jgi:hypothetical protein